MAIGYEDEMKRFGGYNPKMSDEMKASGQPTEMELSIEMAGPEMESDEEAIFQEMAPQGKFSKKAMNSLVKSANELLPSFGQEPTYPTFEEATITQFPTDFVRVLAMFQGAVNAAVDAEMVDAEYDFMMEDLTDDRAVMMLAGKLKQLARQRDFKAFLKNPPMEEEAPGAPQPDNEMNEPSPEDINALFAKRM